MRRQLPFSMPDVVALLGLPVPPGGRVSYNINCPCCDTGNKRHLNINLQKGVFKCPRCGFGGGMLDLYAYYTGMDKKQACEAIKGRLHIDDSQPALRRSPVIEQPEIPQNPLTDIETRDATYRALLNKLKLASDHRENLLSRGLSQAAVEQGLYRTTPIAGFDTIAKQLQTEGCYLAGVPGFYRQDGAWQLCKTRRGILIPVRDQHGRIQGLKVRLDNVQKRKFRWVSSSSLPDGCGCGAWPHIAGRPQDTVILIEGPLKADIVNHLTGMPLIAVSGVSALDPLTPVLEHMRRCGVKRIMTAFDMDMISNRFVQKDFRKLAVLLDSMGFRFGSYLWDPRFKGLDDYVAAYAKEEQPVWGA